MLALHDAPWHVYGCKCCRSAAIWKRNIYLETIWDYVIALLRIPFSKVGYLVPWRLLIILLDIGNLLFPYWKCWFAGTDPCKSLASRSIRNWHYTLSWSPKGICFEGRGACWPPWTFSDSEIGGGKRADFPSSRPVLSSYISSEVYWKVEGRVSIISHCEERISGSMRYITSSYMAIAFGSRPPWSSLHGLGEDSTASLNIRVLRPKREWFRLRFSLHHKSCIETKYLWVHRVVLYHLTPSLAGIKLFAGYQPYLAVGKYARWAYD